VTGREDERVESGTVHLVDAEGKAVTSLEHAVGGEILVSNDRGGSKRRTWFLIEEVEIKWLPVSESAFLLWVLVLLVAVWVAAAVALRIF
jgi:hypothetical protein